MNKRNVFGESWTAKKERILGSRYHDHEDCEDDENPVIVCDPLANSTRGNTRKSSSGSSVSGVGVMLTPPSPVGSDPIDEEGKHNTSYCVLCSVLLMYTTNWMIIIIPI